MCQQGTDCPGMESHNFSPRYDISIDPQAVESIDPQAVESIAKLYRQCNEGLKEITDLVVNKKYVRDICTQCGEVREAKDVADLRQHLADCYRPHNHRYLDHNRNVVFTLDNDPPKQEHSKRCKCDHPCHKMYGGEYWLWKVCPMGCGLPLAGKE